MKTKIASFVIGAMIVWAAYPYIKDLPKFVFPIAWGVVIGAWVIVDHLRVEKTER